ncbi:MAG: hypothetical protein DRP74_03600 [Candidatus Omnitrophota bacterium]|nr:MAG: hypothetical protein DRP74_03600 [Candidatus Omnitrophota bacterium]
MNDIEYQISFVANSVERILEQVDRDIISPTFGCAHPAYWRDRTSDFADMRRQEVALPLALLYTYDYPDSPWKADLRLKDTIEALLSFWCKNQYPDGSMDEWYKGERAFAAVAFSTHAVARTLGIMKNSLSEEILFRTKEKLDKTGNWLVEHDDIFKANHQAVGVAALAAVGEILEKGFFKDKAYKKIKLLLNIQTKEGYFPEIGQFDIGYTFLTIEFILMAMHLWGDWKYIEPFRRAFDFACEWVHPDLSTGKEYGICQNIHISRIAIILMSKFSQRAAYLRKKIEGRCFGFKGHSYIFSDDLRLLRNCYSPLLAYDYAKKTQVMGESEKIPLSNGQAGTVMYDNLGLARFSCCGSTGILAAVSGGLVRLFGKKEESVFSDYGYALQLNKIKATNYIYNSKVRIEKIDKGMALSCSIVLVKKFMPPLLARKILRLACITPIGASLTRNLINIVRKRIVTPINQSSANLSLSQAIGRFNRQILFQQGSLKIKDKIQFKKAVPREALFFLESVGYGQIKNYPLLSRLKGLPEKIKKLEIVKLYSLNENWELKEITGF